eukprot:sb/3472035/
MTDFFIAKPAANWWGGSRDPLEYPGSGIAFRSITSCFYGITTSYYWPTPKLKTNLSSSLQHKRRYCCGLREARKYLKLKRVKCIIIPPNIDRIVSKGGLFDCVHDIVAESTEQCVPIICGLNKTKISKILARPKSTITSAVSIFNYEGAEVSLFLCVSSGYNSVAVGSPCGTT